MWSLIKNYLPIPTIKTSLVIVLVTIAAISGYLGWSWLQDTRSLLQTQEKTINGLNSKIGAKDKQIEVLDLERRAADSKASIYAARTEKLNQENQVNAQNAQKYKLRSDNLKKQLKELQLDTQCAGAPIPDDVIRVQRQSIDEFNTKYSR